MGKRMNKEELIELIESLKLDRNEYWILSSGALVIRGIYPDAGDLDIAVTEKGLQELKNNYNLKKKDKKEIDEKVVELVKREHEKAKKILTDNRKKLDELAMFLYEKETITGEEFMKILNNKEESEEK